MSVRSAFDPRSKIAPLPAVARFPFNRAPNSSYSTHVSLLIISARRSEPPSTWMSEPNGYGPGSDSSAYWNFTGIVGCAFVTTSHGMP